MPRPNTAFFYDAWNNNRGSLSNGKGGWCRESDEAFGNNGWDRAITGKFDPGELITTIGASRINMPPYAAMTYIVKT